MEPNYATAERVWADGDLVEVKYEMKLRREPSSDGREVVWYGPWLLGASAADNASYFNELTTTNQLLGEPKAAAGAKASAETAFSIPIAALETDYAQAEYPDQPGRAVLRPIAEQTDQPTTSWELLFLRGKS